MPLEPGIYDGITEQDYHADTFAGLDAPILSASIAAILMSQSALHAYAAHPKLGADAREESETFDLGTIAHAVILEGTEKKLEIIEAPDWRTKGAQFVRDAARKRGMVPILSKNMADVRAMASEVRRQLSWFKDPPLPLATGKPERVLLWQEEDGIWCKARVDWLHDTYETIDDLKTTGRSANPDDYIRSLYNSGGDIQPAFYLRGLKAITGKDATFRFIVAENCKPYAVSAVSLGPAALALAQDRCEQALRRWRKCVRSGNWGGYTPRVHHAEPPAWALAESLEYEWAEEEGG